VGFSHWPTASLFSAIREILFPEIFCNIPPNLPKYVSGDQNKKPLKGHLRMKTFLVYDLDTGLPVAVGEAIKSEWARVEAAGETDIRAENLIAEELELGEESEVL
jgi:hypothetical protein